jgi:hypothetical protein
MSTKSSTSDERKARKTADQEARKSRKARQELIDALGGNAVYITTDVLEPDHDSTPHIKHIFCGAGKCGFVVDKPLRELIVNSEKFCYQTISHALRYGLTPHFYMEEAFDAMDAWYTEVKGRDTPTHPLNMLVEMQKISEFNGKNDEWATFITLWTCYIVHFKKNLPEKCEERKITFIGCSDFGFLKDFLDTTNDVEPIGHQKNPRS